MRHSKAKNREKDHFVLLGFNIQKNKKKNEKIG